MGSKLEYWFAHGDSVGYIFKSEKFGRVIVFDGNLKLGEPFLIHDGEGNNVENNIDLIELLTDVLPRGGESDA